MRLAPLVVAGFTLLGGVGAWHEARYAKAADVERLHQAIRELSRDLRIGQLEKRRTILRSEYYQLKTERAPSALERRRLNDVENELHDVEQQLDRLRQEKP